MFISILRVSLETQIQSRFKSLLTSFKCRGNSLDLDFGVCNRFWSLAAVYKNSKKGKGRKKGRGNKLAKTGKGEG